MVEYSAVLGAGKNWSPQSQKAIAALKGKYNGDLKKAWDAAGWRWYPVPAPKTKSHEHRFYPPSSSLSGVAAWQTAAKKKPRSTKKPADAPDLNLQYLSSPEACLYLASGSLG